MSLGAALRIENRDHTCICAHEQRGYSEILRAPIQHGFSRGTFQKFEGTDTVYLQIPVRAGEPLNPEAQSPCPKSPNAEPLQLAAPEPYISPPL